MQMNFSQRCDSTMKTLFYTASSFRRETLLAILVCGMLAPGSVVETMFAEDQSAQPDSPNIVWILSEDNSIHYLSHFFKGGAKTPHLESLAQHGLTFDNAFSNAPVCSVARTTLATGCYGPRIGTQFHRKYALAQLPAGLRMFPAYLRDAGYYTTNNSKKDYNAVEGKGVWDESSRSASWRKRKDPSQPFFHMESHAQSHESSLHFNKSSFENERTKHSLKDVQLADYHPDTPLFRYTHARYLDRMLNIDEIVGSVVKKLKQDGLLEKTFIFYFGDHGGVLPRSKGYLYESGLHVPLIVRVPNDYRHLVPAELNSRMKGFVSFIDFGPTVLHLAGVKVPNQMDGKPFLGKGITLAELNQRNEAFGYADRFDEKYDLVRSLRKGRYQYIRQFQPWLPDGLNNNYRYKCLAYSEWRTLFQSGKLNGAPKAFFEPKPIEMLFDCQQDPHQVRNLATDAAHAATLHRMRKHLQEKMTSLPDLSFYPESYLVKHAMNNPVQFGQAHLKEIQRFQQTADLALKPFAESQTELELALKSKNEFVRYWACMVCSAFGSEAKSLEDRVRPLLKDSSLVVRMRAAEFLGLIHSQNPQPLLTEIVNSTSNPVTATEALNSIVLFRDFFGDRYSVERADFHPVSKGADIDDRLNYINGEPYPKKKAKAKKAKAKKRS